MQQIVQNLRSGKVEQISVPMPACGAGEVLVATQASLISAGTEKMLMEFAGKSLIGKAQERPDLVRKVRAKIARDGLLDTLRGVFARLDEPMPLGYSAAGQVVAVGAALAQEFTVGQTVAIAGAGLANHAEFNAVPRNLAVPLPATVPPEQGAYATLGAIALQGVRQADVKLGDRVLVVGLGLVGQLATQLAAAAGARVAAVDPNPARVQLARQCAGAIGAQVWAMGPAALADGASQFTAERGFDAILLCASSDTPDLITQAAELARDRATVVLVGKVGTAFPYAAFMKKELQIRLSRSYGPGRYDPAYEQQGLTYPIGYVPHTERDHLAEVVHLLAQGKLNVSLLTTHQFPLAKAEEAYALIGSNQPSLGVLLRYPSQPVAEPQPTSAAASDGTFANIKTGPLKPATLVGAQGTLGVSLIGSGSFARSVLLPALAKLPQLQFRHIISKTGLSAAHAAKQVGGVAGTAISSALNDPQTHAVIIATRHASHANQVCSALMAGKHVWVEKPLALEVPDLQRVAQLCAAASQNAATAPVLAVGFNRRFSPAIVPLAQRLHAMSGAKQVLIRVNAGRLEPSWQHTPEGGGRLLGEACHFTDLAIHLADSPVQAVRCVAGQGQDVFQITLEHANGSLSTVVYSSEGDPAAPKELVDVMCGGASGRMENYRCTTWSQRGRLRTLYRQPLFRGQNKGHAAALAAWVRACKGEKDAALPSTEHFLHSSRVILAAAESLRLNGKAINPESLR
jgi:predicted dehydrogenase